MLCLDSLLTVASKMTRPEALVAVFVALGSGSLSAFSGVVTRLTTGVACPFTSVISGLVSRSVPTTVAISGKVSGLSAVITGTSTVATPHASSLTS